MQEFARANCSHPHRHPARTRTPAHLCRQTHLRRTPTEGQGRGEGEGEEEEREGEGEQETTLTLPALPPSRGPTARLTWTCHHTTCSLLIRKSTLVCKYTCTHTHVRTCSIMYTYYVHSTYVHTCTCSFSSCSYDCMGLSYLTEEKKSMKFCEFLQICKRQPMYVRTLAVGIVLQFTEN